MYIYQVTNLTTKNFYIGFEELQLNQSSSNLDPMSVFGTEIKAHNGDTMMIVLDKRVIQRVGDKQEAKEVLANIAKHHENNIYFLGVKLEKKTPKAEPTSSKSSTKDPQ